MNTQQKLENNALQHTLWATAVDETLRGEMTVAEHGDCMAEAFANAVTNGEMSIMQLRNQARTLGNLNHEALQISDGDLEQLSDADYFEATARSIGHHVSQRAVRLVKNRNLRMLRYRQVIGQ